VLLPLTGCSSGGETEPLSPEASVTYEASPGADTLPLVADHVAKHNASGSDADTISTSSISMDVQGAEKYDWLINVSPDKNKDSERLPGGKSAPVLDVLLRPDGKYTECV
jgi:hypothetical protein